MEIFKKAVFVVPFLICTFLFVQQLNPFLINPNSIFGFEQKLLIQIILLIASLLFLGFFFVIYSALALDWRIVLPGMVLASILPLFLIPTPYSYILSSGLMLSFLPVYFLLERKMGSYITFQPSQLLMPSIRQIITIVLLFASIAFYFASDLEISTNGFKIPPELLQMSLKFMPQETSTQTQSGPTLPSISADQLALLKKNPDLLKQYGLDPKMLDQFANPQKPLTSQNLVGAMVEEQFQNYIDPYIQFVPIVFAVLFYLTMKFFASILAMVLPFLLWLTFFIFEKTKFTDVEIEMREVKKLVV
ncbi:MAG: hypothetical protein V1808_04405 [Candidatus Daviesbacteria bacterium]